MRRRTLAAWLCVNATVVTGALAAGRGGGSPSAAGAPARAASDVEALLKGGAQASAALPSGTLLPAAVAALLRNSGLPLRSFGIEVRPVDAGEAAPWLSLNAEEPFLMASTTKLVTSLAALDLLGREHAWRTTAHASVAPGQGRLAGDLVIVGGDVGLTAAGLRRWFAQMRAEGLDEIAGNIVLRHVALLHEADPAQAAATASEMRTDGPIDARDYHVGKLLVSVGPAVGERAVVRLLPRPANVVVVNDVLMDAGEAACNAWARWKTVAETAAGGPPLQLWVRGRWGAGCAAEDIAWVSPPAGVRMAPELGGARVEPVAAPRLVAALWREAGGRLRGNVVESREPGDGGRGRWSTEFETPLVEVMREMNKTSNNAAAHGLLLALGEGAGGSGLRSAQARMASWLRAQGLGEGDIRVDEGSGRSRAERARPRALVALLRGAWRGAAAQAFVDSLPIAGVDGTLAHRMTHGAASGQAFLKTGTLSDTRALAGYVRARSGKVYAVSALLNHPEAARGTPALDALIEWIASRG